MTESLQSRTRVAGKAHRVEAVEVTYGQIPVRATILQQMVDNFQNRVRDRNTGTLIASPCRQTSEAGSQIGVLGVACRLRCQHQSAPQPTVTFRDPTAPSLTRALIVARADPRPGTPMPVAGKLREITTASMAGLGYLPLATRT